MPMAAVKPELPTIAWAYRLRQEARVVEALTDVPSLWGHTIGPHELDRIVALCWLCYPQVDRGIIRQALSYLTGSSLTSGTCTFLAGFLAANERALLMGQPVAPARSGAPVGWTLVKVVDIEKVEGGRIRLHLVIRDGPWYGVRLTRELRIGAPELGYLAWRVGVSNRKNRLWLERELVGMYLFTLVKARTFGGKTELTYHKVEVPAGLKARNRILIQERQTACPLKRRLPCSTCPIGYDRCSRACREHSKVESGQTHKENA